MKLLRFWRNDSILLFLRIDNHSSVMSLKVVRHFYRCENCLRYQIFPLFPHPLPDNNVLWAADLDGLLGQCQQAWTSGYSWLCLDHGALRDLSNPFLRVVSRLQEFVGLAPILAPIPSDTMPLVTDLGFWLIGRHICLSVRSAGHLFFFFSFCVKGSRSVDSGYHTPQLQVKDTCLSWVSWFCHGKRDYSDGSTRIAALLDCLGVDKWKISFWVVGSLIPWFCAKVLAAVKPLVCYIQISWLYSGEWISVRWSSYNIILNTLFHLTRNIFSVADEEL